MHTSSYVASQLFAPQPLQQKSTSTGCSYSMFFVSFSKKTELKSFFFFPAISFQRVNFGWCFSKIKACSSWDSISPLNTGKNMRGKEKGTDIIYVRKIKTQDVGRGGNVLWSTKDPLLMWDKTSPVWDRDKKEGVSNRSRSTKIYE